MPLPVTKVKYCCGGGNALLVEPLWPMKRRGKKYYMALYQCKCCKEYSLRGETQARQWNCFVELLSKKKAQSYIIMKKEKIKHEVRPGKN